MMKMFVENMGRYTREATGKGMERGTKVKTMARRSTSDVATQTAVNNAIGRDRYLNATGGKQTERRASTESKATQITSNLETQTIAMRRPSSENGIVGESTKWDQ